jgi:hypothetical protein
VLTFNTAGTLYGTVARGIGAHASGFRAAASVDDNCACMLRGGAALHRASVTLMRATPAMGVTRFARLRAGPAIVAHAATFVDDGATILANRFAICAQCAAFDGAISPVADVVMSRCCIPA